MYAEHFGLNEKPFSISPDPRYLYLSQRHADALAHLLYGISESGGFIQLTGEVGTGKTTLIRSLLGQLPEHTEIALILNPQLSSKQFLQAICQELDVPFAGRDTARQLIDRLNARLLELHAAGKRAVLIVDEAQTMGPELLEQVRLLTNLETVKQKLLQIILIGQPELREMLSSPTLRQVAQRITGRYHLEPLSPADTAVYVAHRMRVAGGRPGIFSKRAVRRLYRYARGIPRLINVIADRALLAAYTRDEAQVGARLVGSAADEVFGNRPRRLRWWRWAAPAAALLVAILVAPRLERGVPSELALALAGSAATDAPAAAAMAGAGAAVTGLPDTARRTADASSAPDAMAAATPTISVLDALVASASGAAAVTSLFELWSAEFTADGGSVCDQAQTAGLRCLALEGASLSQIHALRRPALLEIGDDHGGTATVLLTGIDGVHAHLRAGGPERLLPAGTLARAMTGKAELLFRPAIGNGSGSLAEGAAGTDVLWLRTVLAELGHAATPETSPDRFDAALAAAVRAYQDATGLGADGVVGDRTLISLQTDVGLIGVELDKGGR